MDTPNPCIHRYILKTTDVIIASDTKELQLSMASLHVSLIDKLQNKLIKVPIATQYTN